MAKESMKRQGYDGNACLLNEEIIKTQLADKEPSKDLANELKKRGYKAVKRRRWRLKEFFKTLIKKPSPESKKLSPGSIVITTCLRGDE